MALLIKIDGSVTEIHDVNKLGLDGLKGLLEIPELGCCTLHGQPKHEGKRYGFMYINDIGVMTCDPFNYKAVEMFPEIREYTQNGEPIRGNVLILTVRETSTL